jgi:D-beta-D-heptose 7-phosphate kinase/D-beta-D-heptose 1-phosphate adenosyltransferase
MDTQQRKFFNVLVIGDSCIDRYHYGVCERLSAEAPVPVLRHQETMERPGMCLNVLENLKSFGMSVKVITNSEKIFKERFVDIKSRQHIMRVDYGEHHLLKPLEHEKLKDVEFSDFDAIIISDYDKGFIKEPHVEMIINCVNSLKKQIPIFVDTKKKNISFFHRCILKVNEDEYNSLTHSPPESSHLIVTLGERGAMFEGQHYDVPSVEIFDVSGAGDTFLSSLVEGFLRTGGELEKAIRFANQCAAVVVSKSGTYAITREDRKNYDICI